MKVSIIKDESTQIDTEIDADNIRTILSILKLNYGQELTDEILNNQYKFVLLNTETNDAIALDQDTLLTDYTGYNQLLIVQDLGGELPVLPALVAAVGTTAATVITAVINIGLSIALNAIMNALSPTNEFSSDPSKKQKSSNLFNGGVMTREAGGSVPFLFGNCFTGGVVISAGVTSKEE